jgi:uncharacterized protein (TIGR02001 family)
MRNVLYVVSYACSVSSRRKTMILRRKTASRMTCLLVAGMPTLAFPALAGDLEASAGVASTYLFRGVDVNDGRAQVFGDLTYRSDIGVYVSGWGSSAGNGANEFDAVLGFSHDIGPVVVNIGVINYIYPGATDSDDFGSESEAFMGASWNGFELYYYDNIASKWNQNAGYFYVAASYTWKQFAVTLGHAADDTLQGNSDSAGPVVIDEAEYSYTHLDATYAFNDNLSFTVSKIVDRNVDITALGGDRINVDGSDIKNLDSRFNAVKDDSLMFLLTYSLPLEF